MTTTKIRPEFLSISDTARLMNCSTQTVRAQIKRGDLTAYPLGPKTWRIPIPALAAHLGISADELRNIIDSD